MNPFGPTGEVCVTATEMLFTDFGRGVGPQKYQQGAEGSVVYNVVHAGKNGLLDFIEIVTKCFC